MAHIALARQSRRDSEDPPPMTCTLIHKQDEYININRQAIWQLAYIGVGLRLPCGVLATSVRPNSRAVAIQQILGRSSPVGISTIRSPPMLLTRRTIPPGSSLTSPTISADRPKGWRRMAL